MNELILAILYLFSFGYGLIVFIEGIYKIIDDYDEVWGYIKMGTGILAIIVVIGCINVNYSNIDEPKYECTTIDNQTVTCTSIEKESGTITGKTEDNTIVVIKSYKEVEK